MDLCELFAIENCFHGDKLAQSKYFVLIIIWCTGCTVNGRRQPGTRLRERPRSTITFRGLGLRAVSFFFLLFRVLYTERKATE